MLPLTRVDLEENNVQQMNITEYPSSIQNDSRFLHYKWNQGLTTEQLDIIIASGAFISGFMFDSLLNFKDTTACLSDDTFCKLYGIVVILTTLLWFIITFMAMHIRLFSYKFLLVQNILKIVQFIVMLLTMLNINMFAWFRQKELVGENAGMAVGIITTTTSVGFMSVFLFDFVMLKK